MEQTNLFQFTIEHAAEMMIVFEAGGQIVYANPAAETLLKYKEALNTRNITDIFPMEESWIRNPQNIEEEERELMA